MITNTQSSDPLFFRDYGHLYVYVEWVYNHGRIRYLRYKQNWKEWNTESINLNSPNTFLVHGMRNERLTAKDLQIIEDEMNAAKGSEQRKANREEKMKNAFGEFEKYQQQKREKFEKRRREAVEERRKRREEWFKQSFKKDSSSASKDSKIMWTKKKKEQILRVLPLP